MRRHYLTVRNVPVDLAQELEKEKKRRGASLNQTVLMLLREALGVGGERRTNGLGQLAGSWSAQELEAFEVAVRITEKIDEETWE